MQDIGFQHNLPEREDWDSGLTPAIRNRIDLLDDRVRRAGFRLFIYSPAAIDPRSDRVEGWRREGGRFVRAEAPIPRVSGNWTTRTRRLLDEGMGFTEFVRWTNQRGLRIYVPHPFSELLGNKFETYRLVKGYHESLHPYCELYRHSVRQLGHFVDASQVTFVKPSTGSKGDGIVTLRRDGDGVVVTRYRRGKRKVLRAARLEDAMDFMARATAGHRRYIVQHGIDTLRHERSTFDIRVTMSNDGTAWHWLHEARLSPSGSDVSNVGQGGHSHITEDLLFELLGAEGTHDVLHELRNVSFGLVAYLEALHPGGIPEIAFDFALDRSAAPRLLEINTKPGLPGPGTNLYLRDLRPENQSTFNHWVYPHVDRLASFLVTKAQMVRHYGAALEPLP